MVKQIVFAILFIAANALFLKTMLRMIGGLKLGKNILAPISQWPQRATDVLQYFFLQRTVAREGLSWHHLPIFWGFLIITVGTVEIFANGFIPTFSFATISTTFDTGFKAALDVTTGLVLFAVFYAFYRRLVVKPRLIPMSLDAGLILGMISMLCISHFTMHGFRFVTHNHIEHHMVISSLVATWASAMPADTAHILSEISWWIHVGILLFFLNYIPHSKHIHLIGSLPNILLRNRSQAGVMPKLDLEDESQWGVSKFQQFTWKSLLDTYACTDCARCSNNCPAMGTDKPLSPMHLIHDIRNEMLAKSPLLSQLSPTGLAKANGQEVKDAISAADQKVLDQLEQMPPLVGGRIKDETLWACTTCGACEAVCPVFIEHPMKIMQMRTNLVLAEGRVPSELARMFRGVENNGNPWGIAADKRMAWADGLDIPTMAEKGSAEYLVWVGCAGSYDDRGKKITRAWTQLLQQAGVDFAVLGEEESCTGDSARRAGNEFLFQTMAETNIETLKQYNVQKILTTCPHCFHSLKNEYQQFGTNYDVQHHTEFLQQLVSAGKLTPSPTLTETITYHDPCYLGRWNKVYDEPRQLVNAVVKDHTQQVTEMPRHGYKSFCCGAGGAHMWLEEDTPRVNVTRTEEAIATGAKTIATACPYCNVMVSDGVKSLNQEDNIRVADIAELLAESIQKTTSAPSTHAD